MIGRSTATSGKRKGGIWITHIDADSTIAKLMELEKYGTQ
jgi:hypothetical protein